MEIAGERPAEGPSGQPSPAGDDAPKASASERTINDVTKRRQTAVSVVGADFVRGRDDDFGDGRWGHVKSKARSARQS